MAKEGLDGRELLCVCVCVCVCVLALCHVWKWQSVKEEKMVD